MQTYFLILKSLLILAFVFTYSCASKEPLIINKPTTFYSTSFGTRTQLTLYPNQKFEFIYNDIISDNVDSGRYEINKKTIRFLSFVKTNKFRVDTSLGVVQYCDSKNMDTSKIKLNNHSTKNLQSIAIFRNDTLLKKLNLSSKETEKLSIPMQGACRNNMLSIQIGNYKKKIPLYSSLELTINIDTTYRLRPIITKAKWSKNVLNCKIKTNPSLIQDETSFSLTK